MLIVIIIKDNDVILILNKNYWLSIINKIKKFNFLVYITRCSILLMILLLLIKTRSNFYTIYFFILNFSFIKNL